MDPLDAALAQIMEAAESESGVGVSELRPQTRFACEVVYYLQLGLGLKAALLKAAATFYAGAWRDVANREEAVRRVLQLPDTVYFIRLGCRRSGQRLTASDRDLLHRWATKSPARAARRATRVSNEPS